MINNQQWNTQTELVLPIVRLKLFGTWFAIHVQKYKWTSYKSEPRLAMLSGFHHLEIHKTFKKHILAYQLMIKSTDPTQNIRQMKTDFWGHWDSSVDKDACCASMATWKVKGKNQLHKAVSNFHRCMVASTSYSIPQSLLL